MPTIKTDGVLDLEAKRKLLKEIDQDDLLNLFKKNYKSGYAPIKQKKVALDQSVAIAITTDEKKLITDEILSIKKMGGKVTLSSVMRSRVLVDIDLIQWKEKALQGLRDLNGDAWNKRKLTRDRDKYMKQVDNLDMEDTESQKILTVKVNECNKRLLQMEKPVIKRSYRLRGRVTFNEANLIRWRAARLSLSVADYMRFLIFSYLPYSDDDKTLSIESRKRFYVSILDVAANGWGTPPEIESCKNCVRYLQEIKELKDKLERLQKYSK